MRYFNKAMLVASAALCLNLSVFSQNITLKTGNVTVKEAMEQLKKSSGYSFVFSSVDVDTQKHISISVQDGNIDDVVRQILAGQIGITYEIKDKNIIIKKSENGVVSSKKLQTKGSVRDVNGEPIIGATVMERGTSNGTITDIDGNFMLEVPEGAMLDISYVGYKNQSVQVLSGKQITRVRDNILKSKEQKNIQPTKGGHKMVTCQNYVSLFYRQITSCPSDGGIS